MAYRLGEGVVPGTTALYIVSMAVCPSFRGRGAGKAMLHHVLQYARRRCCSFVSLHVRASNAVAISLCVPTPPSPHAALLLTVSCVD